MHRSMADLYSSPPKGDRTSPANSRAVKPPSTKKGVEMDSEGWVDVSSMTAEQESNKIKDLVSLAHQFQTPGGFQQFPSSTTNTPINVGIGFRKSNSPPVISNTAAFAPFPPSHPPLGAVTSGGKKTATKVQSDGENVDLWKLKLHEMCQNNDDQNLSQVIERLKENNSCLKDKGSFVN